MQEARALKFKPFTAHNDKMGVDWSVMDGCYVVQWPPGPQIKESRYKEFLETAVDKISARKIPALKDTLTIFT